MSDTFVEAESSMFGTFDAEGNYTPRQITSNDLTGSFEDYIGSTIVEFEDGDIVKGTVVKILGSRARVLSRAVS
jgi:small subunit ribosomal protein S1